MLLYALEFVSSQLLSGFGYFMLNACNMIAFAIVDNMPLGHNTHLYWLLLLLQRNIHRIQRVNEKRNQEYNTLISFLLKMAMSGKDSSSRGSNGKKRRTEALWLIT